MDIIKESFDHLPTAICFFDSQGIARLINHKMLYIMCKLRSDGIQTLDEFRLALHDSNIQCINDELHIYQFSPDEIIRFTKENIVTSDGIPFTQVIGTNVTELIRRQNQLKEENEKLTEANNRLRKIFEKMPDIIREEETLEMKLRVHDDIGHSILASRRALLQNESLDEIKESAALWEQSIAILYRSNEMINHHDLMDIAISRANEMGVKVILNGDLPSLDKFIEIISLLIRECAANCVRHADGTELYVSFLEKYNRLDITITNNGTIPKEEIHEGGGLSMLRRYIEEINGEMFVQSSPHFALKISLPY